MELVVFVATPLETKAMIKPKWNVFTWLMLLYARDLPFPKRIFTACTQKMEANNHDLIYSC